MVSAYYLVDPVEIVTFEPRMQRCLYGPMCYNHVVAYVLKDKYVCIISRKRRTALDLKQNIVVIDSDISFRGLPDFTRNSKSCPHRGKSGISFDHIHQNCVDLPSMSNA